MRQRVRLLLSVVVLLASACAGGSRGIPEFQHYRTAFDTQHAAGTRVFDRLADGERQLLARLGPGGSSATFDPDTAAAELGLGDPPRTAMLRGGLTALHAYNEALAALASGASGDTLTAGLSTVLSNLSETRRLVTGGSAPAAVGFEALAGGSRRVLPLMAALRTSRDREAFRTRLIAAHPAMREVLTGLRAATPAIFLALREARVEPGNLADPDGITAAGAAALAEDRQQLAGWVVLIDRTLVAMDAAVEAARSGEPADITALVEASIRLRSLAEAIQVRNIK